MSSFDMDSIDTRGANNKAAVLILTHPLTRKPLLTDDNQHVTISLLGADSDVSEKMQRGTQRRRLKNLNVKMTPEELEEESLSLLVALTVEWQNVGKNGVELECTPDNVRMIYTERPWVRKQADAFVGDLSNYLGN